MAESIAVLRVIHIISAIFMAAPLYLMIMANERARAGKIDYNLDRYVENIFKRQPIRCYGYIAAIFASGLVLAISERGATSLVKDPFILLKILLTFVILFSLSYVHLRIQPRVERVLSTLEKNGSLTQEMSNEMMKSRMKRKKIGSICLFLVPTVAVLGIRLILPFSNAALLVLIVLIALFVWRAFNSLLPYGWV